MNMSLPWLCWWDADGQLILLVDERPKQGSGNVSKTRAESLAEQNRRMENKLRSLGIDPNEI
ncbi:MAG TPA: hypothetical protein P5121_35615 [Caldilineaceae bacterium]|nr:hypothetical protein [Caldilineaceae bacterium]